VFERVRGEGAMKGPKAACEAELRVFEVLTGRGAGGDGARMGLQKGFRRASACAYMVDK
jgi:hypothetical protein